MIKRKITKFGTKLIKKEIKKGPLKKETKFFSKIMNEAEKLMKEKKINLDEFVIDNEIINSLGLLYKIYPKYNILTETDTSILWHYSLILKALVKEYRKDFKVDLNTEEGKKKLVELAQKKFKELNEENLLKILKKQLNDNEFKALTKKLIN